MKSRLFNFALIACLAAALAGCSTSRDASREPMFASYVGQSVRLPKMWVGKWGRGNTLQTDRHEAIMEWVEVPQGAGFYIEKVRVGRNIWFHNAWVIAYGTVSARSGKMSVEYGWPEVPYNSVPQDEDSPRGSWIGRAVWEDESVPRARRVYPKSKAGQVIP